MIDMIWYDMVWYASNAVAEDFEKLIRREKYADVRSTLGGKNKELNNYTDS